MRTFRLLLLILCFVLGNTAALAETMHACCHDCTPAHCADMGCSPAAAPIAVDTSRQAALPPAGYVWLPAAAVAPDQLVREVWRPPNGARFRHLNTN